jgi:hypothetical protein
MLRMLAVVVLLLNLGAPDPVRAEDKLAIPVRYRNDKLSVNVTDMPLTDVLKELGRKSGAEIKGEVRQPRNVTTEFEDVPLTEALERLLGEQNFTLTYGDDGGLKTVELRGGPEAPTKPKEAAAAAETNEAKEYDDRWVAVWKTFNQDRGPVPVGGKLAELTGKSELNWDYVVNMAYGYEDDAAVRSEAVKYGLKALENDPELRARMFETTGAMSDAELAEFARTICKHNAEDFVKRVARHADGDIRTRAVGVLRELRQQQRRQTAGS